MSAGHESEEEAKYLEILRQHDEAWGLSERRESDNTYDPAPTPGGDMQVFIEELKGEDRVTPFTGTITDLLDSERLEAATRYSAALHAEGIIGFHPTDPKKMFCSMALTVFMVCVHVVDKMEGNRDKWLDQDFQAALMGTIYLRRGLTPVTPTTYARYLRRALKKIEHYRLNTEK